MTTLVSKRASYDSRCPLCEGLILGYDGSRHTSLAVEIENTLPPAHPIDVLDRIVELDGRWVHDYCAREQGHVVVE